MSYDGDAPNKTCQNGEDDVAIQAVPRTSASDEKVSNHPDSDAWITAANRQLRDAKTYALPSPDQVKDRIFAERRRGPHRPLARLADVEAQLEIQSAALARLSKSPKSPPDKNLVVHQLARMVDTSRAPDMLARELRREVVGLYSSLQSEDPIESILNRIIVATTNTVMACNARAMEACNTQAIDMNLRNAAKGAKSIIDLIEARDRRRGPRQVVVKEVNVAAGGQAIVGNVETHPEQRQADKESRSSQQASRRADDS